MSAHGNERAADIAAMVRRGDMTAEGLVSDTLRTIAQRDVSLCAFLEVFEQPALREARAVDAAVREGRDPGPLAGVPIALKDNICLSHGKTTCASRMLEHYESPYTATAAQRLIDAGAVIVGKTNLDEFAMGSSCEQSAFGPTRNPHDAGRVPGGSSGGSAAAVSGSMVPIAIGSDTGGSIRQPAAFCGAVGFKPTYGRISRYGLVAFASSLDQIGPIGMSVADCALAYEAMAGVDAHDATSSDRAVGDVSAQLVQQPQRMRIGVPRTARSDANHPGVADGLERAIAALTSTGAEIVDIDLPHAEHGIAAYYIVAPAEASSNLARFDGVRYGHRAEGDLALDQMYRISRSEGFGDEVKRRIMLGTHVLSSGYHDAYYNTALKVRRRIKGDYDAAFAQGCTAILSPTTPTPAFKLEAHRDDPLAMYLEDIYTVGVNLAGLPAISVPAGTAEDEGATLPVGVQLVGPAFEDTSLLQHAAALERALTS